MNVPPITLGLNGGGPEIYDAVPLYYVMLAVLASVDRRAQRPYPLAPSASTLAAIRDNELRAWTLGHDVRRLKMLAFALSGAVAGLAGALFVVQFGFASPSLIGFSPLRRRSDLGGPWRARQPCRRGARRDRRALLRKPLLGPARRCAGRSSSDSSFMACVILFPRGVFGELIQAIDDRRAERP